MKKIIMILCCVIFAACSLQTKHRGYVFQSDLESDIAAIKTTRQLQEELGDPQVKTLYGDEIWIYYCADEQYRGPLKHKYTDKTVVLAWVQGSKVVKTRILRNDDLPNVKIDSDETPIPAAIELNAFQELFNNVGRFSPAGLGQ